MITEFAAGNVPFTLKKYICCLRVVTNFQNNTHTFLKSVENCGAAKPVAIAVKETQ